MSVHFEPGENHEFTSKRAVKRARFAMETIAINLTLLMSECVF